MKCFSGMSSSLLLAFYTCVIFPNSVTGGVTFSWLVIYFQQDFRYNQNFLNIHKVQMVNFACFVRLKLVTKSTFCKRIPLLKVCAGYIAQFLKTARLFSRRMDADSMLTYISDLEAVLSHLLPLVRTCTHPDSHLFEHTLHIAYRFKYPATEYVTLHTGDRAF